MSLPYVNLSFIMMVDYSSLLMMDSNLHFEASYEDLLIQYFSRGSLLSRILPAGFAEDPTGCANISQSLRS